MFLSVVKMESETEFLEFQDSTFFMELSKGHYYKELLLSVNFFLYVGKKFK